MILFYLLFLTVVALVLIGGYDATMRLVIYIDLKIRQFFLDIKIWFFKRKLKKRLLKDRANLLKEMENNNHAKERAVRPVFKQEGMPQMRCNMDQWST